MCDQRSTAAASLYAPSSTVHLAVQIMRSPAARLCAKVVRICRRCCCAIMPTRCSWIDFGCRCARLVRGMRWVSIPLLLCSCPLALSFLLGKECGSTNRFYIFTDSLFNIVRKLAFADITLICRSPPTRLHKLHLQTESPSLPERLEMPPLPHRSNHLARRQNQEERRDNQVPPKDPKRGRHLRLRSLAARQDQLRQMSRLRGETFGSLPTVRGQLGADRELLFGL